MAKILFNPSRESPPQSLRVRVTEPLSELLEGVPVAQHEENVADVLTLLFFDTALDALKQQPTYVDLLGLCLICSAAHIQSRESEGKDVFLTPDGTASGEVACFPRRARQNPAPG
jgi:hypothetical protein